MRATRILMAAFLALALAADTGLTQPPPDSQKGGRGPRGGSDGFSRRRGSPDGQSRSYGRGDSSDGQSRGFGRSFRGGPSKSSDPNGFFDKLSGGKDVWKRSESDSRGQMIFDRFAERLGVTNGEITRQQFLSYMNNKDAKQGLAPAAGASPTGTTDPNADRYARLAEMSFRSHDKNGDGRLEYDEMPADLQAELSKWDTNKNGTIELEEYKAYYIAKREQRSAEWAEMRGSYGGTPPGAPAMTRTAPSKTEPKQPLVYTKSNLPKELPSWFRDLADVDGQISFSEWRAAGRSVSEFRKYDLNSDGFITVPEVMAYQNAQTKRSGAGRPSLNIAQGGTTVAGNPASFSPSSPPTVSRVSRPSFPPSPGSPNSTRLDISRFRRNRGGDPNGGSPPKTP